MIGERYAMDSHFTGVFQQVAGGWIGSVEELPGANTQGRTLEETREDLKEAIRLVLDANREIARRETQGREVVRESIVVSLSSAESRSNTRRATAASCSARGRTTRSGGTPGPGEPAPSPGTPRSLTSSRARSARTSGSSRCDHRIQ